MYNNYSRLQVRIGDTDISNPSDDEDINILDVIKAQIHPNYKNDIVYFDVAILTTEPVNIQPGKNFINLYIILLIVMIR